MNNYDMNSRFDRFKLNNIVDELVLFSVRLSIVLSLLRSSSSSSSFCFLFCVKFYYVIKLEL